MSFLHFLFCLTIFALFSACSSLPSWTGKFTREDGKYDLYSEPFSENGYEFTIVKKDSPKVFSEQIGGFLGTVKGEVATEMQLCRNGLCAKECLDTIRRTKNGLLYESCSVDYRFEGLYR